MNFRSSKSALLFGAINGAICALFFKPAFIVFSELEEHRAWQHNIDLSTVRIDIFGLSVLCAILFMLSSYTVHRFWAKRIDSTIILWQVVAIVAIVIPSICLYLAERVNSIIGAYQIKLVRSEWGYIPSFVPNINDLEFAILFLCLAISVNFAFGAIISRLEKIVAK